MRQGALEYACHANAWIAEPTPDAFASAIRAARRGDAARIAGAHRTAMSFALHTAAGRYLDQYEDLWHSMRTAGRLQPARADRPGAEPDATDSEAGADRYAVR